MLMANGEALGDREGGTMGLAGGLAGGLEDGWRFNRISVKTQQPGKM